VRLPEQDVAEIINATLAVIQEELQAGESVTFPGFGKFYTSKRQGGSVRHATSHELIAYAPRRVALFHTGDILKRAVRVERRRK
jgi:nucleoid DNA-binding protein